jgi:CRISPR-associated protein Csm4
LAEHRALLLRCREGTRFHLGETSLEDTSELLHADTLFSALTHLHAPAFGAAEEFVQAVAGGHLRFSSGLHVGELPGSQLIWFVPRPPLRYTAVDNPSAAKRLREIRYVSLGLLRQIGASLRRPEAEEEATACGLNLLDYPRIGSAHACTAVELEPLVGGSSAGLPDAAFVRRVTFPQVQARVPGAEDAFFHTTSIQFLAAALPGGVVLRGHFGVLLEHSLEEPAWQRLLACFRLLADEGVGGERSSGMGRFDGVEELPSPLAATPNDGWTLGLAPVIPADSTEFRRAMRYELFTRGGGSLGRDGDPALHRQRVRMIREGALFRGAVRGRIVEVSPLQNPRPHPILRCGIHFPLSLEASA